MGQDDSWRHDPGSGSVYAEQAGEGEAARVHSQAVGELTPREKLILHRRRLEFSQEQMAALFGIHRETYGRIERGQIPQTDDVVGDLGGLLDHEKCYILRKRSGRKQIECAQEMGVTRFWFNQMELGKVPCEPLIEFWRKHAG